MQITLKISKPTGKELDLVSSGEKEGSGNSSAGAIAHLQVQQSKNK